MIEQRRGVQYGCAAKEVAMQVSSSYIPLARSIEGFHQI
jgi:hypothetical protein